MSSPNDIRKFPGVDTLQQRLDSLVQVRSSSLTQSGNHMSEVLEYRAQMEKMELIIRFNPVIQGTIMVNVRLISGSDAWTSLSFFIPDLEDECEALVVEKLLGLSALSETKKEERLYEYNCSALIVHSSGAASVYRHTIVSSNETKASICKRFHASAFRFLERPIDYRNQPNSVWKPLKESATNFITPCFLGILKTTAFKVIHW